MCSASRRPEGEQVAEQRDAGLTLPTCAARTPSPRLRGEGWGEGQPEALTLECATAPHPSPLPAQCGERVSLEVVPHLAEAGLGAVGEDGLDGGRLSRMMP